MIPLLAEPGPDNESIQFFTEDTRVRLKFLDFSPIRSGGTKANVEVYWNEKPHVGLIKQGWVKFGESLNPWSRDLSKVAPTDLTEREWHNIMQAATYRAQRWYSMGEPFERIGEGEVEPTTYLLYPILPDSGATVIAAPGGSGKSFLALSAALTVATGSSRFLGLKPNRTGPVLYLDWEDERTTQDERVAAICRAKGFDIPSDLLVYQRMRSPLANAVPALQRKVMELEHRPVLVIIDSVGKARGGNVNDSEGTNHLFGAIDKLRMPAFCIDHKSKEAIEFNKKGPIGSIYTWNSARAVWDMENSQAVGAHSMVVKMSNVKNNRGKRQRPLAWEVNFESDHPDTENEVLRAVNYTRMAPSSVTILTPREQSNAEQVESILAQSDEALTVREITERCELSNQAVRSALAQHPDLFDHYQDSKGTHRWSLTMRSDQQTLPAPF